MQISMAKDGVRVTFSRPVVGPKHYVAIAGGGWTETFLRTTADAELCAFAGKNAVGELIDNFLEHMRLADKGKITWSDITLYLARNHRIHTDKVPMMVAVAFWAKVAEIEDADSREAN